MRTAIIAFACGVWLLQRQAQLPGIAMLAAMAGSAALLAIVAYRLPGADRQGARWQRCRRGAGLLSLIAAAGVAGFCWAALMAQVRLADRLEPRREGEDVTVVGVVASLPQPFDRGARFEFDIEQPGPGAGVPSRVLLSWYNGLAPEEFQEVVPLRAGERWRFTIRLRRPHGNANPHGFDYEAWLLERGLRATGYVRPPARAAGAGASAPGELPRQRLDAFVWRPAYIVERLREAIRERFWDALPDAPGAGVLIALAIGDQKAIEPEEWQVFARTGVSHLMSISGLHVTMVAGLFAALMAWLWRRSERLMLRLPARRAAAVAGFAAAFAYCLLAGFAVPAQRTLYMIGIVALSLWLSRSHAPSRVLAVALALVLLLDPWAVLSPGFWLSFGAVTVIFHVSTARPRANPELRSATLWFSQWLGMQWAITIGLVPLLLILFQQVSLSSPFANAIAIPLVSLVITPLALAGAVLPFDFLLHLSHWLLEWLMPLLAWLAALDASVWQQHAPAAWTLPLALLGLAWLLMPRGFPARAIGLVLLAPMLAVAPAVPDAGTFRMTVLDVGQGLAVLLRTRDHALLYDAGPSFSPAADSGNRVIVPFLRGEGVRRLDVLVVSHQDNDHAGGAASVLAALPTGQVRSSLAADHPLLAAATAWRLPCRAGDAWDWDGVRFEFLHPEGDVSGGPLQSNAPQGAAPPTPERANDRSCVLKVSSPHGAALLTGDIERRAEQALLERRADLRAAVLVVPHHGSGTSSLPQFIEAVAPASAVFTVGYRNRFGHPRADVMARYRAAGSDIVRTDALGAVRYDFGPAGIRMDAYRESSRRYWHGV